MTLFSTKTTAFALLVAAVLLAPVTNTLQISTKFSCKGKAAGFAVSTGSISAANQKKIIIDNFRCESYLCPKLKISAKIRNSDDQIFNSFLYTPTLGCDKDAKYHASNKETRYIVELDQKHRLTDIKSLIFTFEEAAFCTLDIPLYARNAVKKTDPEDYQLKCSDETPKMLVLFDFNETNCRNAFEGKLRILNNKNLEIRGFKSKDLHGYKNISFRVSENTKGWILRILEFFHLRSDFKTKVPMSDLSAQEFDEADFLKPKTVRLVLPSGFQSTDITELSVHDGLDNVLCSIGIEDPPTVADVERYEVADDSVQPFSLSY